ncbi:MAG TPA: alpha-amylase family glycosyl hydrolase [Pseudonocardiaceae bacterium]
MRRSADSRNVIADNPDWWRNAVFYQVHVRSFADSDGDGVGDLEGIRSRLGYLELLGVDALWLTPFHRSPMAADGHDVTDPRDVDPLFGDLATFDRLVADAHAHGLRVTIDLAVNHTGSQHEWFRAALRAGPGSPERNRYVFRDGRGPNGELPPNNWRGVRGGPAWTRADDGQWYLHLLGPDQPNLNWDDPEVRVDLERTLRFWLDRGVDGFRIGAADAVTPPPHLPDVDPAVLAPTTGSTRDDGHDPRFDHDGVHEIHRAIRRVLDEYPGRIVTGEIRVWDEERFARYLRPDELHLGLGHRLVAAPFDADAVRREIERSVAAVAPVGAPPAWMLSHPDTVRHLSRYGGGETGLRRARAMALVLLALPGAIYLYNGEELGLPHVDLPEWTLHALPKGGSESTDPDRNGCRVPLPWEGDQPPYGFSSSTQTWLPMPSDWGRLTVEAQLEDPDSVLSLYRQALELRRTHPAFSGQQIEWYGAPPGCFAFRRKGSGLICALNTSGALVPLPPGEVLLASSPLQGELMPPDTAAWLV